jgi:hypothetical protein
MMSNSASDALSADAACTERAEPAAPPNPPVAAAQLPAGDAGVRLSSAARQHIDELILPLRTVVERRLDLELGERLSRIAPMGHCLCVLADHGGAGLDPVPPRLHGTMPADSQALYATLIGERDPLLTRAGQEWRPIVATLDEHAAWIRAHIKHAQVILAWLARNGTAGAQALAVVPARGWLSRGALFVFSPQTPADQHVLALFYAAQRLAVTLELRHRPYIAELLALRFTAREVDVLRAGLKGSADDEIAARLGLSVDAIRYYYKKFKHRVPPTIGHLKPRDLARILHHLGKL